MPQVNIDISRDVFAPGFLPLLTDQTPEQIFIGGGGSGKSRFIFQRAAIDLSTSNLPQRNYLVVRNTQKSNRDSTFNEFAQVLGQFALTSVFSTNQSNLSARNEATHREIYFRGLDDTEKLKSVVPTSGVITDIVYEEASEMSEKDFDDTGTRLRGGVQGVVKRQHVVMNPTFISHWVRRRWCNSVDYARRGITRLADYFIHHSTHDDNPFLTDQDHKRYSGYASRSPYHDMVYGRGEWGVLGGSILTNYEVSDLESLIPAYEPHMRNGLDFGYSSDKAAMIRCAIRKEDGAVLVFDVPVYRKGLTNDKLAELIKPIISDQVVTCDSAEPKSIAELFNAQVTAIGAKKGKDSVRHSIQWLQQRKIIINKSRCQPLINEISQWQWKKDKWGEELPEPVDANDHAISALRYALEQDMGAYEGVQFF